jgi:phenylacetate-CoA ligase
MNKLIEDIYYHCPVLLQNTVTSLYGYYLHNTRYGKYSEKILDELLKSQYYSSNEMHELQRSKMKDLIMHAYSHVPYYNELFNCHKLRPENINDINDLEKIPLLRKDIIRGKSDNFVYLKNTGKYLKLNTSGTTGSPLVIICDIESRKRHYAFLSRFREWFGIKMGMRRASFFGRIVVSPSQKKPPYWRFDISENNFLFSSYHMSEENLKHYYNKLLEIKPIEISGYPSSLYILSKYIIKNKLQKIVPSFIMTTAETLLDYQREMIEDAFCCKVRDQYGCTEMALFVSQCEQGSYHVHPEYGIIEVIDADGNVVDEGKEGEIVCTSFINRAMPLIRYKLGDNVIASKQHCSCGRNFPVIENIVGRVDDILITPDGRPLGRLDPIFKSTRGIYETQVIQTKIDTLQFNIVKKELFGEDEKKDLLYEINKRTGNVMKIELNIVPAIQKDKNGKFRSVVSLINNRTSLN